MNPLKQGKNVIFFLFRRISLSGNLQHMAQKCFLKTRYLVSYSFHCKLKKICVNVSFVYFIEDDEKVFKNFSAMNESWRKIPFVMKYFCLLLHITLHILFKFLLWQNLKQILVPLYQLTNWELYRSKHFWIAEDYY